MTISSEVKSQLLEEILGSETFLRTDQLRRLLRYICEMEMSGKAAEITESSIAVEALGRPPSFVPSEDTIVRNRIHMLRERLADFYLKERPQSTVRIELPKGSYVPRFVPAPPATLKPRSDRRHFPDIAIGALAATVVFCAIGLGIHVMSNPSDVDPVLREAWGPLGAPGADPIVVLGIPTHLLVRGVPRGAHPANNTIDLPAPPEVAAAYNQRSPQRPQTDLHLLISQSLRLGEAIAAVVITRTLDSMHVGYQVLPDSALRLAALRSRNTVLIGDPTLIPIISKELEPAPISIEFDGSVQDFVVKERAAKTGQQLLIAPDPFNTENVRQVPGLLTVLSGSGTPGGNKRTLLLSCANSAGCQAAAEFFSSPQSLKELRDRFRKEGINGFPASYQVVIKARTDGVVVLSFSYVAHRVLDRSLH